jgi:cell division protease FtsH
MAGRWGMSDRIGPVSVLPKDADPRTAGVSEAMLDSVDEEIRRISDECYAEARRLLRENRDKLDSIVEQLLEHETLDEAQVYAAAGIARPTVRVPVPA